MYPAFSHVSPFYSTLFPCLSDGGASLGSSSYFQVEVWKVRTLGGAIADVSRPFLQHLSTVD